MDSIFTQYLLLNGVIPLNLSVANILSKFVYLYMLTADPGMINEEKSERTGNVEGCKAKNLDMI